MNVITKNPVKYQKTSSVDGINANSIHFDIMDFQDWMDIKHPNWVWYKGNTSAINLNKGKGYGTFGENTAIAWKNYGNEYLADLKSQGKPLPQIIEPKKPATNPTNNPTNNPANNQNSNTENKNTNTKNSTKKEEEKKGMSLGVKIAIGVGVIATFGTIIYFATKKK